MDPRFVALLALVPCLALSCRQAAPAPGSTASSVSDPAPAGGPTAPVSGASCPLGVRSARVEVRDIAGGAELTVTADVDHLAQIRARAQDAAALHGPGSHRGPGHDGHHLGAHTHGLRLTELPPVTARYQELPSGARISLQAIVPHQVDAMREHLRENVATVMRVPCRL
jgi:hypothetical protein